MVIADVMENDDSQGPLSVSAEIDVRDPDVTEKFEHYITGEENFFQYYLMSSSDLSQILLSNVRRPTSTTEISPPSNLLSLDLSTRRSKF